MAEIINIDIFPTIEEVSLTLEPNLITINVTSNTGGGGTQTLAQTLDLGNATGGENILVNNADAIELENTSLLKKGTYNFGGNGGISRICSNNYEDMWQNGFRHVFDQSGFIRNSTNCFNVIPDSSFDVTLRFKVGSIWTLDDGTNYICTDATEGDAVWEIYTNGLVPYTAATQDVNLGEFGIQLGNLEFDNTPTNIPTAAGSLYYNDTDGTLDLILKGGNVKLQIGQESLVRVVNKTATNINLLESNYQAVRVTGAQGQRLKVDLAQATTDGLSAETIGIVTETINNNQEGFITTNGLVRNINTTGSLQGETWVDGDILYLSPTVAGRVTKVKPTAPNHLVIIGYVIHAHATQGTIFVKVDNGYELNELHNVLITSETNNQALIYETSTDLWKNKTVDKTFVGLGNVDNTSDANKPVSSATQTALNLKQNASNAVKIVVKDTAASTAVTGVTTEQPIATYLIPANTFNANDVMRISSFVVEKTGIVGTCTMRIKVGTTATFGSATTIATYVTGVTEVYTVMIRNSITLRGGNLRTTLVGGSRQSDLNTSSNAVSVIAFNPAVDNYIFTSLQLSLGTESVFQSNFLLTN